MQAKWDPKRRDNIIDHSLKRTPAIRRISQSSKKKVPPSAQNHADPVSLQALIDDFDSIVVEIENHEKDFAIKIRDATLSEQSFCATSSIDMITFLFDFTDDLDRYDTSIEMHPRWITTMVNEKYIYYVKHLKVGGNQNSN